MCLECGKTFSDRSGTILSSSKLSPSQLRKLFSMLSDGTAIRQLVYQEHVSLQTALLWKRKSQKITENGGNKVFSAQVLADYAYINAPASMRKGKNRRGLSKRFFQIAVKIDTQRTVLLRHGVRGLAGGKDSSNAFLGHVVPGSIGALQRLLPGMQGSGRELQGRGSPQGPQSGQPSLRPGEAHLRCPPPYPPEERPALAVGEGLPDGARMRAGLRKNICQSSTKSSFGKTLRRREVYGI